MKEYNVKPIRKSLNYSVKVPGSKSITNRALLLAAMANGRSKLSNVLFSDDSRHFINCLRDLGYDIEVDEVYKEVIIMGGVPNESGTIDVGSAGTGARFLTAMLSVFQGEHIINASNQMKERPMRPLFDALKQLNVNVTFLEKENHLPVVIKNPDCVSKTFETYFSELDKVIKAHT